MRVLHLPYTYFPDPVGGTEIYVSQLARALVARGVDSAIAAPGAISDAYVHEGLEVRRYGIEAPTDIAELHNAAANSAAVAALSSIITALRPDIVHFHAYTRGVPLEAAEAARAAGIQVVVTYHTPTVTCARGTLILNGDSVCDGALFVRRCAGCVLRAHNVPGVAADALARVPVTVGRQIQRIAPRAGGPATALRMTELMHDRHERVRDHFRRADAVVAPSGWVAKLLLGEGVSADRLVVVPQGIDAIPRPVARESPTDRPVRFILPARYSPEKGIAVVIAALRLIPAANVRVDIIGPEHGVEAREHRATLEALAAGDERIRFCDAVAPERIIGALAESDAVLVPSTVMETGPLVVLEAFVAGRPVIGADLGGIAERVRAGVDGMLVASGDVSAWADALYRFATDPQLRSTLTSGVRPPIRMSDVAEQMSALYTRVSGVRGPR